MPAYQGLKTFPLLTLEETMAACGQGPVPNPHSGKGVGSEEPSWAPVLGLR